MINANLLEGIHPSEFGLPPKYQEWRKSQIEGVDLALLSDLPIVVECQPTGSGKSGIPICIQKVSGEKLVILTATKALADQYMDIGKGCGMVDVRGMANYKCSDPGAKAWESCADGVDNDCSLYGTPLCDYSKGVTAFKDSDLGVTNYQFFMHSRRASPTALGDIRTLVLDECHEAMTELGRFLTVRLSWDEINELNDQYPSGRGDKKGGTKFKKWRVWAAAAKKELKKHLYSVDQKDKTEKRRLKELDQKLWWIASAEDGEWVWEPDHKGVTFECIWPGRYSKSALFGGIERIIFISATVRPYTMQLLGVGRKDYVFKEWPRVFPLNRMPFIHIPTIAVTWKTCDEELESMVARVDEIIEGRLDRKGLIHTKSYDRALYLYEHSKYARHMILNDSRSTRDKAEQFRKSDAPKILVSPSYSTGWDFPGRQCEYQIIVKVPFAVTITQLAKQRKKDKRFNLYSVMQELVQMRGRGMRSDNDRCETFILDNHIQWVEPAARRFAPSWWQMRTLLDVPDPPPRLPAQL